MNDDDTDFMDELPSIDEYDPEDIDVEVLDAFHVGAEDYVVSVQLSDRDNEAGRSYLLAVTLGRAPVCRELLRIEDLLLCHATLDPRHHVALQVGGVTHHLSDGKVRLGQGPEPFTNRLWHLDPEHLFLFGDEGTICRARGAEWIAMPSATRAFIRTMDGPRPDLIRAAGDHGALLRPTAAGWEEIPLDLGESFMAIHVRADGSMLYGAESGACGMIRDDQRTDIEGTGAQISAIESFRGRTYWADDENGLFGMSGASLIPVRGLGTVCSMHASAERLAISGWNNLFAFDGESWAGVRFGFDGKLMLRAIDMDREFP